MTKPRPRIPRSAIAFALVALHAHLATAQQPTFTPFKPSGIYDLGEKAGWNVTLPDGTTAPMGGYTYTIKKNNQETISSGTLDLSSGKATIETTLSEPAMLYVQVSGGGGGMRGMGARGMGRGPGGGGMTLGAAIAPSKVQPAVPRPADFDTFWDAKLKALAEVPINPVVTPAVSDRQGVELYSVKLDSLNGSHAQGYLAKPPGEGKFPALALFEWAGVHALRKNDITARAAEGWLAFNVESHDMPPDQATAPMNYTSLGNTDKEQSYFLNMYLRDVRAIDYLISRPDWNGKVMLAIGTSMGGQQSLCVSGLHPKVTHMIVNVPSGCDTNGALHGRQAGYPNWPSNNPRVMQTALYFDPVNFSSRNKATSLVAMGFIDTTSPPVGVWTALNQIQGPKEVAPMIDAPHNNLATPAQLRPYSERSTAWLNALVKGGELKVNEELTRPKETKAF